MSESFTLKKLKARQRAPDRAHTPSPAQLLEPLVATLEEIVARIATANGSPNFSADEQELLARFAISARAYIRAGLP